MKYQKTDRKIVFRRIEDEGLILDVSTDKIYQLTEVGAFIWELVMERHDITDKEIIESICHDYNSVSENIVQEDVNLFLDEMLQYGLVLQSDN